MHLDDERDQRLLHGELEPAGERLVREHLTGCEDCRALVDEARAEEHSIFGLLREIDHPLPEVDPRSIIPAVPHPLSRWERWAAGILLVAAAGGAAYAAPGSPLPAMVERLLDVRRPPPPRDGPSVPIPDPAPAGAGIAIEPGDRLTIRFLSSDSATAVLSLGDGDQVTVQAMEGVASFTSDVDHLSVRSRGPARFEISIPRSAPLVEILAGDLPVFRKRASDVVSGAPPGDDGRYVLILSPPGR